MIQMGFRSCSGQATVEYAAVLFGVLSLVAGFAVLARLFESGALMEHALMSASHCVQGVSLGSLVDVFLY